MPKRNATAKRRSPNEPLDPEKIAAIMTEAPDPEEDLVTVFPLSAEEALMRAMTVPPPGDANAGRRAKG